MKTKQTVAVPVEGVVEITNSLGDTIYVNPKGRESYSVQLIRGKRGRCRVAVLNKDVSDLEELRLAVDRLLDGDYEELFETDEQGGASWYIVLLSMMGTLLVFALGLIFLAYMISVFLKWN